MPQFPLSQVAAVFFRIGNTTFGGGDPTIAALQRELVDRRRVLAPERYGVVYALARLTPGTNMLAFCAGVGWVLSGWAGSLIAVTAVTLPSAVIAVMLLNAFEIMMRIPVAASALGSMIAAAVGLMFAASYLLIRPHCRPSAIVRTLVIAASAFVFVWKNILSPVEVIGLAALTGLVWPEPAR
jgi:chromate transporter